MSEGAVFSEVISEKREPRIPNQTYIVHTQNRKAHDFDVVHGFPEDNRDQKIILPELRDNEILEVTKKIGRFYYMKEKKSPLETRIALSELKKQHIAVDNPFFVQRVPINELPKFERDKDFKVISHEDLN